MGFWNSLFGTPTPVGYPVTGTITTTTAATTAAGVGMIIGGLGGQALQPGMWQQVVPPPSPYTTLEIINVLECQNSDDATEKIAAFRKMIPQDQDLVLYGKWIFVVKSLATVYPGMAIQIVIPTPQVNTTP